MRFIIFLALVTLGFTNSRTSKSDIREAAEFALASYDSPMRIESEYGNDIEIFTVKSVQIVIDHKIKDEDWGMIAIRGTANPKNVLQDLEYLKTYNADLDMYIHRGFNYDARFAKYEIKKRIDKNKRWRVTGHSLGGAVAAIVSIWLASEGYAIVDCTTFGQPMYTTRPGILRYQGLVNINRVVRENDPIPHVPPRTLLAKLRGAYTHGGNLWFISKGGTLIYTPEIDLNDRMKDFGRLKNLLHDKIKYHSMKGYLKAVRRF